jgi:hypothetical protein
MRKVEPELLEGGVVGRAKPLGVGWPLPKSDWGEFWDEEK